MATIAEITPEELRALIESIIEEKLLELLGDPDEGYALRKAVRERLLRQRRAVAAGERGISLEQVVQQLDLK